MITHIGKYRVVKRIGRGGMGIVFEAVDPTLDRVVALKVISDDEVSEELKARFYREAKACARLNHPNIVVVHDLGEDAGRLYIVMEFLEGEDLKHLIQQRRSLSLEQKLGLMVQVCDGLHYAHENGVIHRDVKPGNIFVLRNGRVKILDFGLARIMDADSGLTRSGLIMGTLRYVSPEQVRGKADRRSDIFSVGAVFYELLSGRPAFDRDSVMEVLEQLRSEEPPPLARVDPSIPTELAAIIERALRKDPDQRFPDLGQMRLRIEGIRQRLTEELRHVQGRVRGRLVQVRELHERLAGYLGQPADEETVPVFDDRACLADLEAFDRQLAVLVARLGATAARAEVLGPMVAEGVERLGRGDFPAAIAQLEPLVRELPDHRHAREALQEARARQEEVARTLSEARAAWQRGAPARALELLDELGRRSAAAVAAPETVELRRAVETACRDREAAPRLEQAMHQARDLAEPPDAAPRAADPPTQARDGRPDARLAMGDGAYRAGVAHSEAVAVRDRPGTEVSSHRVEDPDRPTGEGRRRPPREAVGRTDEVFDAVVTPGEPAPDRLPVRLVGVRGRRLATVAAVALVLLGVLSYARRPLPPVVVPEPPIAAESPRPPDVVSSAAPSLERTQVEERRKAMLSARDDARKVEAERLAPTPWTAAAERERDAEAALGELQFGRARAGYADAEQQYRRAAGDARAESVRIAETAKVRPLREQAAQARRKAEIGHASDLAPASWAGAVAMETGADDAMTRQDFGKARALYRDAERAYGVAEGEAARKREVISGQERERLEAQKRALRAAEQVAAETAMARDAAERVDAVRYASKAFALAGDKEKEAYVALGRLDYRGAQARFREASQEYGRARQEAEVERKEAALRVDRQRQAEQLRDRMAESRGQAEQADARRWAASLWQDAVAKESEGQAALGRGDHATAQQRFRGAQQDYDRARQEAVRTADVEKKRLAEDAEQKRLAAEAEQKRLAEDAEQKRLAEDAEKKRLAEEAERRRRAKLRAEETARLAALAQDLEAARGVAIAGRDLARKSEADRLATELFDAARSRESQAEVFANRQQLGEAVAAYRDAAQRYGEAVRRTQGVRQARSEAGEARSRMQTEKQKARSDRPEFTAAVAEEQQGDVDYQRLAFKEAASRYGSAEALFARAAAAPSPRGGAPDSRGEIRLLLEAYKRAMENKDVALLTQVRPNLSDPDLRAVRRSFQQSKSQTMDVRMDSVDVRGDEAEARVRRVDTYVTAAGREHRNEGEFVFHLKRAHSGWVIDAITPR